MSGVRNSEALHALLAEIFEFPGYYGKNWDAFWDCINEESHSGEWQIVGFESLEAAIPEDAAHLRTCLSDLQVESSNLQITYC